MAYNSPGIIEVRDEYRYFDCPISRFISLTVIEQAVDINFGTFNGNGGAASATYSLNDLTLFPGSNPIPQACDCIRYKNHTRGVSGRLVIAARLASDLPRDVELSTSYVPSYYRISPEGRVEATFEGHIRALGLDLPNAEFVENPEGNNQITWRKADGTIESAIYGFANPRTENIRGIILGSGHNSEGTIKSGIEILETNREARGAFLSARALFVLLNRLALQRTWLDQEQRSSYLQWLGSEAGAVSREKIAIGSTERIRFTAGWATYRISLPSRFATAHTEFMAGVREAAGASTFVGRSAPNEVGSGIVDINSTINQENCTIWWMATGE